MEMLKIDAEFKNKIPAMPKEDFEGLRADILRDGYIRDPLVVWKEENILLDGHHRWQVICENLELLKDKYTIDYKSFPDRYACIAWICANQLHKHNMSELQRMKLIQEEYEARRRTIGAEDGFRGNQHTKVVSGENRHLADTPEIVRTGTPGKIHKTRPTIAKEHNITESEVKVAVNVGRGIDRAADVDPEFKREVLSGEVKALKKDLAEIRKMENDDEVKSAIAEIRSPSGKIVRADSSAKQKSKDSERRALNARLNAISNDMANMNPKEYTQKDLLDELKVLCDDFTGKVRQLLKERKKLIGDGEKVYDILVSCEKSIMKIEEDYT